MKKNEYKYNRIFLIITDSLGIGGDKRAKEFGDHKANTLLHVSETGLLRIPTWKKLGIDSIAKISGFNKSLNQQAYMARMNALSNAKDTLAGHWEMMGIITEIPFPTFTQKGFPPLLIDTLEKKWKKKIIGNKAASGTDILNELAPEEINSQNKIIVYTSADSVLQICGHEDYTGLENLHNFGKIAREVCNSRPDWKVGRIIVRPYVGSKGNWIRTSNRRDFSVEPPQPTILEGIQRKGIKVIAVGKIADIFSYKGISQTLKGTNDLENMDITIDLATQRTKNEFIFVNLVDFDSKYGHRRDPSGYAQNLNNFDIKLSKLINAMNEKDLLIISSDHGNDPTMPGSDHTREHVPVTIYAKNFKQKPKVLPTFEGFATIGNLVAKNFQIPICSAGENYWEKIV